MLQENHNQIDPVLVSFFIIYNPYKTVNHFQHSLDSHIKNREDERTHTHRYTHTIRADLYEAEILSDC